MPENIKAFRAELGLALDEVGFVSKRRGPRTPTVWELGVSEEVVPMFIPHAMRRPWGFNLSGWIAIEIADLRRWLAEKRPSEGFGVFHLSVVNWHIANDQILNRFRIIHGEPAPMREWAEIIRLRLIGLPRSLDELTEVYRHDPHRLLGLASDLNKPAWKFLLHWAIDRDTDAPVPQSLFH